LCQHLSITIPVLYLQNLQKEEKNISRLAGIMAMQVHWENFEKKLVKEVPSELSQEDGQAFMQQSKTKLRKFSKLGADDEALHKVRKLLKDLLYNYRFLKFASPGNYKTMETLTHDLGEHHDLCISLSFSGSVDDQPIEQDILNELRQQWHLSKEELGKENICRLNVQVFSET
jgi:hypothetical protein